MRFLAIVRFNCIALDPGDRHEILASNVEDEIRSALKRLGFYEPEIQVEALVDDNSEMAAAITRHAALHREIRGGRS